MTTTQAKGVVVTFVVNLHGMNIESKHLNTQLPRNKNDRHRSI